MSKKKLNATQKKLIEIIENLDEKIKLFADKQPFDFKCINDYCSGKTEERVLATVWKDKKKYIFFCDVCGDESSLTKEEFKIIKQKLSKEEAYLNMEKAQQEKNSKKAA